MAGTFGPGNVDDLVYFWSLADVLKITDAADTAHTTDAADINNYTNVYNYSINSGISGLPSSDIFKIELKQNVYNYLIHLLN